MNPPRVSLVVPCFDEEDSLPTILPALTGWLRAGDEAGERREVVFVDDGSRDGTGRVLSEATKSCLSMRLLTQPLNRGVGAAMRTGLHAARGDVVVCYDADMTYPLADVDRLVEALADADVASASPFLAGAGVEGVSAFRRVLTRGAALCYRLVLGRGARGVGTFTCAFRAYRGDLARGLEFASDGFPAAGEIMGSLLRAGARVVEVPSVLAVRGAGRSSLRVGRTTRGHLDVLLRLMRWHPPRSPRPARRPDAGPVPDRDRVADLNRELPMRLLDEHVNPVVRQVEARRRRSLMGLCGASAADFALDVGAEGGHLAARLAATGARVVRCDLDPAVLTRGASGPGTAADAELLPFADGVFDLVLLSAVLEHVPDPARAVAETLRVLKPSGRAIVSVPDDGAVLALKRLVRAIGLGILLGPLSPGRAPGHVRVYSPRRLRETLAAHGRVRALIRDLPALSFHAVVTPTPSGGRC